MIYEKEEMTFNSIADFYIKVELVNAHETTSIPYRLKDIQENTENESDKKLLTFEIEAFKFMLSDGRANGCSKSVMPDGVLIYEYPNVKEITNEALEYYYNRSLQTSNNSLKIRYQQIIVSSESPHYVSLCFKSLIDFYVIEIKNLIAVQDSSSHEIKTLLKSAFVLTKKAKYRVNDIVDVCFALLQDGSVFPVSGKYRLLELIINNRKYYSKEQLNGSYQIAVGLSLINPYHNDCFATERLSAAAIRLAKILLLPFKEWHEKMGLSYEAEMKKRTDDESKMMPMHWCEKAIEQFQYAGNESKVKELHLHYTELRKDFKLDTFSTELDREAMLEWYDSLDKKAKYLVTHNEPDTLLNYLSEGNDIFPNITWLQESAKKRNESFFESMAISKADINKNFSKKIISNEEHDWHKIFESYQYYTEFSALPLLRRIFFYGFIKEKICYKTIIGYLQKNTWIGSTLISKDSGGNPIKYNWLSLIAPALFNFHQSFEALLLSKSNQINIVLPVDSLILKFEGLFRDFARLLGTPTTFLAKGNMREMYIEELLELEEMKNYFDENDMLLFRYIFISKNGLNLRNNIAHAFLQFNQYRIEYMLLMVMALLRLGKYTVDTSKQTH